ncbi:ExbD/TolR family protein [Henriciella aquimarina]|uniref:ExbD/TolR family protein n=1 Tax=Henriciella aquimarina TaxID=545261 RepID=UPI000A040B69|nr:biopolymer transporter ExbD [Henriciella aquimarina]
MKRVKRKAQRDPVISLINIVFLILIFFMVAGSLAAPPDPSIRFVQTENLDCCVPPDAIAIDRTGRFIADGVPVANVLDLLPADASETAPVRLLPDRELPAATLLERVGELRAKGAARIIILTEDKTS